MLGLDLVIVLIKQSNPFCINFYKFQLLDSCYEFCSYFDYGFCGCFDLIVWLNVWALICGLRKVINGFSSWEFLALEVRMVVVHTVRGIFFAKLSGIFCVSHFGSIYRVIQNQNLVFSDLWIEFNYFLLSNESNENGCRETIKSQCNVSNLGHVM